VAPEESQKKSSDDGVRLEIFKQTALTMFWEEIVSAITASIPDDPISLASICGRLRLGDMTAWGIWSGGKVGVIIITAPVSDGFTERTACMIHAIHGHISDDDWVSAARMLEDTLRSAGYSKILAWSQNDRVSELCALLGWPTRAVCWKDL